jgi:glutamate 5-kinase
MTPKPYDGCGVVKLGGGLITRFDGCHPTVDRPLVVSHAQAIAASRIPTVVVHGTGAYGKPPAVLYGYLNGHLCEKEGDIVARVALDLAKLESDVIECLLEGGLRPLRVPALTLFRGDGRGGVVQLDFVVVADLLANGITQVIGGNFVIDCEGFAVCSSDLIAVDLAIDLNASVLVLATNAPGVYREFGRSEAIFDALSAQDGKTLASLSDATNDVSGGIASKIRNGFRAAERGIPTFVIDGRFPSILSAALQGRPPSGTRLLCGRST